MRIINWQGTIHGTQCLWLRTFFLGVPALMRGLLLCGALVLSLLVATPSVAFQTGESVHPEEFDGTTKDSALDHVMTNANRKSTSSQPPGTVLDWAFQSLGWSYSIVFLSLSFSLVALFVMNVFAAQRNQVVPVDLVKGFEEHLNEKRYQEAFEMAKNDESMLAHILSAGLARLSTSYSQAIEAMQEVGEEENMKIEHRLSYMSLIGTISPMIGLFGTVHGMILAFRVIAISTQAPQPTLLAKGISTALFTTLVGLFIAIPAIAAYTILRNRMAQLVLEAGIISEGLMSRFQNVGSKKAPPL